MIKTWSDSDPIETQEWLEALASLIKAEGRERAQYILERLLIEAERQGVAGGGTPFITPYANSINLEEQPPYPGDLSLEQTIEAILRWNAIVMVLRAKRSAGGVGGHLSSFASIATLYEVGFNHFFKGCSEQQLGDLIYFQGHSSEGNYARAFIENRLTKENLEHFRQETTGVGLSSYPHPWLMPNFWQFATVSLGLGMLQGIYQARFLKYLHNRNLLPENPERKVWVFCGDGEMDEPESIAGISMAAREKLDNLIFVVNCNLQRLDGLVRGNGKIIQELEGLFRGAGWNVIKLLWGSQWDSLFAKDKDGLLIKRLTDCVDGDLQTAYVRGGAYRREFIFNSDGLKALIADWSDEELNALNRGAQDPLKVFAAFNAAAKHKGQPTVILALGVKGFGLGTGVTEGRNVAHNQLEMTEEELKAFRKRFKLPLTDEQLLNLEYYKPADSSPEMEYLHARRKNLGGYLPERKIISQSLTMPLLDKFEQVLQGSGDRAVSTTMVLGRIFATLLKDPVVAPRFVPIFSDEVRTFGLENLFRQIGIYSPIGQLYTPEDKEQFLYYREVIDGQVLEEGITEAGCMASWIAAATSYATNRYPMIPFFTFYSMFGFQRVGDFIWAASDMRARGFLIGATAGRTTLEGEGLQHQDGTSLLVAAQVPTCRAYDPAFGYEMAVIIQHGLKDMYESEKDVFYYIMAMNERYLQPAKPEGVEEGIIKGMYLFRQGKPGEKKRVQLLGSGAILNEVIAASELLLKDFAIVSDIWSVTSYAELRRDAQALQREAMLQAELNAQLSYLDTCLQKAPGPIVAASDYVRALADLIRPYIVNRTFVSLGTDGFGRSDTRAQLRKFFEVDRYYIVVAALYALAKDGLIDRAQVSQAIKKYNIDAQKPNPLTK
jgi:pyruvate dehydrogenase E1 component